jgi:hypothetical protein
MRRHAFSAFAAASLPPLASADGRDNSLRFGIEGRVPLFVFMGSAPRQADELGKALEEARRAHKAEN